MVWKIELKHAVYKIYSSSSRKSCCQLYYVVCKKWDWTHSYRQSANFKQHWTNEVISDWDQEILHFYFCSQSTTIDKRMFADYTCRAIHQHRREDRATPAEYIYVLPSISPALFGYILLFSYTKGKMVYRVHTNKHWPIQTVICLNIKAESKNHIHSETLKMDRWQWLMTYVNGWIANTFLTYKRR